MSRKYFPPSDVLCLYNDILYDPLPSDEGDNSGSVLVRGYRNIRDRGEDETGKPK